MDDTSSRRIQPQGGKTCSFCSGSRMHSFGPVGLNCCCCLDGKSLRCLDMIHFGDRPNDGRGPQVAGASHEILEVAKNRAWGARLGLA